MNQLLNSSHTTLSGWVSSLIGWFWFILHFGIFLDYTHVHEVFLNPFVLLQSRYCCLLIFSLNYDFGFTLLIKLYFLAISGLPFFLLAVTCFRYSSYLPGRQRARKKSADPFTTSRAYDWKVDIRAVFDHTLDSFFLKTDRSVVT